MGPALASTPPATPSPSPSPSPPPPNSRMSGAKVRPHSYPLAPGLASSSAPCMAPLSHQNESGRERDDVRAESVRNEGETSEPDPDQRPLQQEEPTAEAPGSGISNCLVCHRPDSWDDMIMCDGSHEEQWYHLKCVGIKGLPPNGTKDLIRLEHRICTDYALGEWFCPDCRSDVHVTKEEASSDENASDDGRVPKKRPFRRSAPRSEKETATTAPRPIQNRSATPASRLTSSQNSVLTGPTRKPKKQDKHWTTREKDLVRVLMEEVIAEQQVNLTEKKWEVISDRLAARFSFNRSNTSIKNYWNRQGRAQTGVDERRKPNPTKLVTSATTAEQRKRARQQVFRASERTKSEDYEDDSSDLPDEDGEGNKEEEEATDDDEGGPPTKRRRCR